MVIVQLGADFGQDLGRKIKGQNLAPTSRKFPFILSPVSCLLPLLKDFHKQTLITPMLPDLILSPSLPPSYLKSKLSNSLFHQVKTTANLREYYN